MRQTTPATPEEKKAIALKMAEHLKKIQAEVSAMNRLYEDAKHDHNFCLNTNQPDSFGDVIAGSLDEWASELIDAAKDWEAKAKEWANG